LGKYRGAEFGAAVRPCATCKAQLRRVFHALGVQAEVAGVVDLLYRATQRRGLEKGNR
jgi:predicted nucleic acid-binding Zn ribbon protein